MRLKQIATACRVWREKGIGGVARVVLAKLAAGNSGQGNGPVPEVWTEYMNWLTFANAGMLGKDNFCCFDYAVRNLPSGAPMIEVGSFCGLSTNTLGYLKEKHGRRNALVTCDRWMCEGAEDPDGMVGDSRFITNAEYQAFIKETFIRNVRFFSRKDLPFTIELFSDEFFAAWDRGETVCDVFGREFKLGGPISFAYIDGNHSYEFARRDFQNCDKYLEPGGFVLLDDSADHSEFQVYRVAHEIRRSGRYELLDRNPNYFFRKK